MIKKKYLNLFLVLMLLVGMLPASAFPSVAFAEGEVSTENNTTTIDTSVLEKAIEQATTYEQSLYTTISWNRFQETLKIAQDYLINTDLTNEAAHKYSSSLLKAFDELITLADFNKLGKEIDKVNTFSYSDYTKESHDKMIDMEQVAYNTYYSAKNKYSKGVTNSEVIEAYENLSQAILDLESRYWIDINTAEDLSKIDGSKQYILTADITGFTGNPNILTGKLDGNGYTVTFADGSAPLFQTIEKDAEVSNLGLTGNVSGGGAFAEYLGGKITNSYSWVNVDAGANPAGGLAGQVTKGGEVDIRNTYANGTIAGSVTGGLIGIGKDNSNFIFFNDSYWVNGETGVSDDVPFPPGEKKFIEDMKDEVFVKALNSKRGDKGVKWNRNEDGLPYFGVEAAPQAKFYPVVMTSLVGSPTETIKNKNEELKTSIFGLVDGYVATLELEDYDGEVDWKTISSDPNSPITVVSSSAKVFVRAAGTVTAKAFDAITKEEIQSFTLSAEIPANFDLSLTVQGENYTNKIYPIPGSEKISIDPKITVGKSDSIRVKKDLFEWTSDNPSVINVSSQGDITVYKEGSATIIAALDGVKKTILFESSHISVETIEPAFEGEYYVHRRSPNSIGQNGMVGVASFNPLRNLVDGKEDVGSELFIANVTPKKATYAKDYTTTTSNTEILKYREDMQNNLLPLKEGTVDLTVTSNDPKVNPKPSGTSSVTIKFFNPLTSLTTKSDTLSVTKGQSIDAGLIFKGPQTENGYHVTESGMEWKQSSSDSGEVSAYRSYPVIMVTDEASMREGTVSNDQWLIKGVKEGTVTLTGTPVDSGHGTKPVTLTINVEKGETVVEKPAAERISEALAKTMDYQANHIGTPKSGDEWTVLGLARAGYDAPADFYETYYSSVIETVKEEAAKSENRFDNSVTDTQRVALALTAIGKDPRNVDAVNLLNYSWNKEANFKGKSIGVLGARQGSNELIFALIAFNAKSEFTQPDDASITREQIITRLIAEYQNEDGGFGLSDNKSSSIDMTAMAIQALAKHQDMPAAKVATDKALVKLSSSQGTNGDYGTSESTSQVILALTEMGIDPQKNESFIKGGESLLDGQLLYIQEDGSFAHSFGGNGNVIATDQAFYTLVALDRFYKKENSLYNMNDVVFDNDADNKDVTSVAVSPSKSNLTVDKTLQLEATVLPVAAIDKSVIWTTDNNKIATVSDQGIVKGLTAGTAKITVTTSNGKTATSLVTVVNAVAPPTTTEPEVKKTIGFSVETRTIDKGDIIADTTVEIKNGDTAFTLLKRQLDAKKISIRYIGLGSTLYVQAINGLGEFDEGQGSGWMYSVNGVFPDFSAGLYELKKGDKLRWRYTTNLGADLNAPRPDTKPEPETKPEKPKPPVVEAPKNVETVVKDNKVEIQIKDDKTGTSKPAPIEKSETVGDFLIVQIGGKGIDIPGGLELPKGTAPKVVVIDNDKPYEYYAVKSETKANKKWDVNFSGALLDSPENLDKVTVKDASGDIIDMKVKLSADGKTVSIHPSAEYEKGELYYITISDVKSASGKTLKQDIRSIFIVE